MGLVVCSVCQHDARGRGVTCSAREPVFVHERKCVCGGGAGIKTRDDVLNMGIDKYNEECRSIVMRYACGVSTRI